jgi:hypothetical protein
MNIIEAEWLGRELQKLPSDELFPLLNIGSSTMEFRTAVQPWINDNIFAPMKQRGGSTYHLDMKDDDGVDLVGDLADPAFVKRVSALKIRSAMATNLFEHVTDRGALAATMLNLVPSGGYLILSGPHKYPYHADPIDTMFRPTPKEMHSYFPGTEVVAEAILDSGNWKQWQKGERGRSLPATLIRLMVPFYRPAKWVEVARQAPYIFRNISAFGLILRKS